MKRFRQGFRKMKKCWGRDEGGQVWGALLPHKKVQKDTYMRKAAAKRDRRHAGPGQQRSVQKWKETDHMGNDDYIRYYFARYQV
jgi:hypothetical protein